jgi:cytochrome c551/c552
VRRLVALAALAVLAAGCSDGVPGGSLTTATPETVIGKVKQLTGNPTAGKAVFASAGCGACHAFKPAGTNSKVGPDLDDLAAFAKKANQGALADFIHASIVDPNAYVEPSYAAGVMPATYGQTLKPQQVADLVAFLSQGS